MRRTLVAMLVVALLLGCYGVCPAQQAKPLVTVAFSGYDKFAGNIEQVVKLVGNPDVAKQFADVKLMGQALGLETTKPWGAVVMAQGAEMPMFSFVPVSDMKKLKEVLEKQFNVEMKETGDGGYEVEVGLASMYLKEKGGWVFIGQTAEALKDTPADPAALLGDLPKKYDLAVRVSIKNVPEELRKVFIAQLEGGMQEGMQRLPGEDAEQYALRVNMIKQMIQQVARMANELDELLVGWVVDPQTRSTYLDFEMTAIAGTKTAEEFAQFARAKTNFAGFDVPTAAVTGNWTGVLGDTDVAQSKAAIVAVRDKATKELENQGLTADELKLAKQLLADLCDVATKCIETKRVDAGMALMLEPGGLCLVAGGQIAEGAKLEKLLKQVVDLAGKDDPDVAKLLQQTVKFDAETHQGVRFHTAVIPIPDEKAAKVFGGQTLSAVVGIADDSLWVAVGNDPAKVLKQVIDKSKAEPGKTVDPFRLAVAAGPIAKFVGAVADDEGAKTMAAAIGAALAASPGKDRLLITTKPIPNGARTRIELEEGVLKILPVLIPRRGPGEPPPEAKAAPGGNPF